MFAFSRLLTEALGTYATGTLIYILGGILGLVVASRQPGGLAQIFRRPARYFLVCGPLFIGYMVFVYLAIGLAANHAEVVSVAPANYPFLSELEKAQKALSERYKFSLKFTQILCNDFAMMLYNFINVISSSHRTVCSRWSSRRRFSAVSRLKGMLI